MMRIVKMKFGIKISIKRIIKIFNFIFIDLYINFYDIRHWNEENKDYDGANN